MRRNVTHRERDKAQGLRAAPADTAKKPPANDFGEISRFVGDQSIRAQVITPN